jgi:hypothetical protein
MNLALRDYVQDRLAGKIANPDGVGFDGPDVAWNGRRAVRRQTKRWSTAWSPEQIAHRLQLDLPEDPTMSISHEAIYQALYIQGRGALRRDLTACLRSGRALRMPRERARTRGKSFIGDEIMISQLPPEVGDSAVPGHWEGNLILGLGSSAIGTLVERTTRFTMLLHLPRMEGCQPGGGIKNGPALAGHGAKAVRGAIARTMTSLPEQLRKSLTWDQGAEMAQHASLRIDTGLQIYFCDPQSPLQRGVLPHERMFPNDGSVASPKCSLRGIGRFGLFVDLWGAAQRSRQAERSGAAPRKSTTSAYEAGSVVAAPVIDDPVNTSARACSDR